MSTKNPRLNIVLEASLYQAIQCLANKEDISLSLKARDLIKEALRFCEDDYWVGEANKREKTFNKKHGLSHKKIWSE